MSDITNVSMQQKYDYMVNIFKHVSHILQDPKNNVNMLNKNVQWIYFDEMISGIFYRLEKMKYTKGIP